MDIYTLVRRHLPSRMKVILKPLHRNVYLMLNAVSDRKILYDMMEYFGLTYVEAIQIMKAGIPANSILWQALSPKTEEDIRQFYKITPFYIPNLAAWHMLRSQRKLRKEVRKIASGDVLEYGGGIGDLCVELAQEGLNVTYGDISGITFEFAEWLFKKRGVDIEVIDLGKEELLNQYDTIICIDVIQHVTQPEAVLKSISSALREEGKLVITHLHSCECKTHPMNLVIDFDAEQLLQLHGLRKTDKGWLWIKGNKNQ